MSPKLPDQWQTPRGTHDILPEDEPMWRWFQNTLERNALTAGFGRIETPMFEHPEVFIRAIGETTDIVEKEMFEVRRKTGAEAKEDETAYILRPEGTAPVVRAYLEHGMHTWPQPVKLWQFGPMFRADRPQRGRYREFWYSGFEVLGDGDATTDALLIYVLWQILGDLKIRDNVVMSINSIGCHNCRPKYRKALLAYYEPQRDQLCPSCQQRLATNPLRLLDCKEADCEGFKAEAPQTLDFLCQACREHFRIVLESLDELKIQYDLTPTLVRGLDYYSRTTFEAQVVSDDRRQSSLAGGGRYDGLVERFGGKSTPAVGFAFGVNRILERMIELNVPIPALPTPEMFVIQLGEKAKKSCFTMIARLGEEGFSAICQPSKDSLKGQLRLADKAGVRFALILGQREVLDQTVIIRDMIEGTQETVAQDELPNLLRARLRTTEFRD